MVMTGIYANSISSELERTKRILNNPANYELIEKFSRDIKLKDGLTDFRVMFYITRLRHIAQIMTDSFMNPSEDNLKECVEKLSARGITPRSVEDYKQTLKRFYSWYLSSTKFSKSCSWIKVRTNVDRLKKSEDMLTPDEVDLIIQNCKNLRDKSLISLLYDTGCRIGEIVTLKLKDLDIDDRGMTVHVTGKTGERIVYVIGDSIAYVKEWRKVHPDYANPNAMLFVDFITGKQMNYDSTRMTIQKAVKRSGLKKRVHPHLFRHSYATRYSEVLSESVLKAQLGWTGSSRMAQKYVHLSGQQQKNAILKANGLNPEVKTIKHADLKICQRCGEKNPSTASYCSKCWFPLTVQASITLKEHQDYIESTLKVRGDISPEIQAILDMIPETDKTGILATIVEAALKRKEEVLQKQ